jgi:hypothetical protein
MPAWQHQLAAQMARFAHAVGGGCVRERILMDCWQRHDALRDERGDALEAAAVAVDSRPQ